MNKKGLNKKDLNKKDEISYLYKIAKHYYQDGMLQNEIAEKEHISRSQVSKLLDRAKDLGIVKFTLSLPKTVSCQELEQKLKKRLNLKGVILSPDFDNTRNDLDSMLNTVAATANTVRDLIIGNRIVGVGWGRTLYSLAGEISVSDNTPEMTIIPLIDNATGFNKRYLQTSINVSRFSDAFMANAFYYNSSDFLNFQEYNDELMIKFAGFKKEQIEQLWRQMDAAIFSVGSLTTKYNEYLMDMPSELFQLDKETFIFDNKAELLGVVFDSKGNIIKTSEKEWRNGIDIRMLKKVKTSICIAVGTNKVVPLALTSMCGFANYIVSDCSTAVAMDEYLDKIHYYNEENL